VYVIIALAIIGICYWAYPRVIEYYQTHRASFSINGKPPAPLISTASSPTLFDRDTDGDGVPDWQEQLFGLDPQKRDTDGDGVPDALPRTTSGISLSDTLKLSDTNKLVLSVYTKFQNVPTESIKPEDVQQAVSDEVLLHAQSIEDGFKRYKTIDLELTDSDTASILVYQQKIDALLSSLPDPIILAKNIQDTILKETNAQKEIDILNIAVTKLLAIPVPAMLSDIHLSLVNAAYFITQDLAIPSDDELTTYTKSIIAQKNINVVQQTMADVGTLANIYVTTSQ
jgi:hypothetical protein